MLQLFVYLAYLFVSLLIFLYGAYCFTFPRLRARLSVWRLSYRVTMAIRHKQPKPVSHWRIWWARGVGLLCLIIGTIWLVSIHPQIRLSSHKLYDPSIHQWKAENAVETPEKARVLTQLEDVTQSVLGLSDKLDWRGQSQAQLDRTMCVAMSAGVIYRGDTYVLGIGRKNIDSDVAPDADTVFEIGSITKVFTAAALASLVNEGQVNLDEPVASYLSGWKIPESNGRKITVGDLATHRSALPRMADTQMSGAVLDNLLLRGLVNPYRNGTAEYVRAFLAQYTLPRTPGDEDEYSNLGMGLLGYALSQKAGQPYPALIEQRVCSPLGMKDAAVHINAEQSKRLAQGYVGPLRLGPLRVVFPMRTWDLGEGFQGCGAIKATVHDMLKFLRANIDAPDGPLGRDLALVQQPKAEITGLQDRHIGLALISCKIDGLDDTLYWHNGGTGGYNSFMAISKKHRVGVVLLATGACDEYLGREIIKALAGLE